MQLQRLSLGYTAASFIVPSLTNSAKFTLFCESRQITQKTSYVRPDESENIYSPAFVELLRSGLSPHLPFEYLRESDGIRDKNIAVLRLTLHLFAMSSGCALKREASDLNSLSIVCTISFVSFMGIQ